MSMISSSVASSPPSTPGHAAGAASSSKYSKLSTEYSKLVSQFGVVKRAVIEEQGKNAEMQDR